MRVAIKAALLLVGIPLLLSGVALGGEDIQLRLTNDGTRDIVVTVYDLNTNPRSVVLENLRVNGFTSVPINVSGDASGKANIAWIATSNDGVSPKCGHADRRVANDSAVRVQADSSCNA